MSQEEKVTEQILRYLREHPRACDTLEGVVRWWVMAQQINESVEAVRQALKELEAEGAVREEQSADGRTLYLAEVQG
jgi:predicted ArsR family transcriptional regulator